MRWGDLEVFASSSSDTDECGKCFQGGRDVIRIKCMGRIEVESARDRARQQKVFFSWGGRCCGHKSKSNL